MKRGLSYLRCTSGQASTAGVPCEAGVVAYDEVDGASIQDRVRAGGAGQSGPVSILVRPPPLGHPFPLPSLSLTFPEHLRCSLACSRESGQVFLLYLRSGFWSTPFPATTSPPLFILIFFPPYQLPPFLISLCFCPPV